MTGEHRPYVQPSMAGPVRRYVARCDADDCGLFVEFVTEPEAAERVADHEEETST